ncbi:MAG: molybdopterin-binding protein [Shimia sp.]
MTPRLPSSCFALPPGIEWTSVDDALALLRERLSVVAAVVDTPLAQADGRVLSRDVVAARANPPHPNSAVDGWGVAGALPVGESLWPIAPGRAAAGHPLPGAVPGGHALRILTGAPLPEGVTTVALQEDAEEGPGGVTLLGPLKDGANTRKAGEDFAAGDTILPAGRGLTPPDLALLAAAGVAEVPCHAPLRVGILSTGDELQDDPRALPPGGIADANRPMLRALVARWGAEAVDLGICPDDRAALRARLDGAECDVIVTSGGASAGAEDHVSALLEETGTMALWRVAVKPGRPLALGLWGGGVPVFGLPGNPVAAFVCALIFLRPALARLGGAGWAEPLAMTVPAAFAKRKKDGRREFLRARLRDGAAEFFASEGSGRISGLSWADGLVDLPHAGIEIAPGDPVRFLPFAGFGL